MMTDVRMPQLGESVTKGTIGKWLKQVGDHVSKYEPLLEVMTDKVNAEIPSDFAGVITEILVPEGETVSVGTVICRIDPDSPEGQSDSEEGEARRDQGDASAPVSQGVEHAKPESRHEQNEAQASVRYSPAVLALSEKYGIDLREVKGSGEHGRISRRDVLNYVNARQAKDASTRSEVESRGASSSALSAALSVQPHAPAEDASPAADVTIIPPSPVRRTIAERMTYSASTIPHAWTMIEVDVSRLVSLHKQTKDSFLRQEGVKLTYLPFVVKAVADGLRKYPQLNAAWMDGKIHQYTRIHIGIAVATETGLVVPVIRDADRQSIVGLVHTIHALVERARNGRLTLSDIQGGTFTVNNTGAFGSVLSKPIINPPQAAILSMESIQKRPVVIGDGIAIRDMMNLCLSLDHRVLDGWVCGQFLQTVKGWLENLDIQRSWAY
nr:dihydrolipoamide acetyltransferase family protein [Alicyclobacillus herbarius]